MYNVKVKNYGNGQIQTRIYSHLVYTGKKAKSDKRDVEISPFDGCKCKEFHDLDDLEKEQERSLNISLKRAKAKIYDYARANVWEWFVTLTFSPEKVDRYDYAACSKKLSVWLNNMRKGAGENLKYIVVPERHKDGAFHFHGLFAGCGALQIVDSGHVTKSGQKVYNIGRYRFGFTTATKVDNNEAVTKYITKYTTKDLMAHTKGKKKYWASRNLNLPVEDVFILNNAEKQSLHNELVEDDCLFYKNCYYEIGTDLHSVRYYEHKLEGGENDDRLQQG